MPGGERQEAGSCEPAGCRRRRASLYQPMALRIANKAAAAVGAVFRQPRRPTDNGARRSSPPDDLKRSNKAGVTEGNGLEKLISTMLPTRRRRARNLVPKPQARAMSPAGATGSVDWLPVAPRGEGLGSVFFWSNPRRVYLYALPTDSLTCQPTEPYGPASH
jgi:hypothetical protein